MRREELRWNGADGAVGGGEICFLVAGFRVGEDDAGVAVEEFVDVVVFGDEDRSAPVERGVGLEESRFVEQGFGGVVHACGSPGAFAEGGEDAEALEEAQGFFRGFGFEIGAEAFEHRACQALPDCFTRRRGFEGYGAIGRVTKQAEGFAGVAVVDGAAEGGNASSVAETVVALKHGDATPNG